MPRRLHRTRSERGQTSAEYLGILAFVAAVAAHVIGLGSWSLRPHRCSVGVRWDSEEPSGPNDDDAVRITQGTNPTVEGLSLGLASVSRDEARFSVFGHDGDQNELVKGRSPRTMRAATPR